MDTIAEYREGNTILTLCPSTSAPEPYLVMTAPAYGPILKLRLHTTLASAVADFSLRVRQHAPLGHVMAI